MMRMTAGNRDGKYQKENESYKWFRRQVSLSKVGVEETKGETSQGQKDGDRDRDNGGGISKRGTETPTDIYIYR